jgi:hypothetical protein
MNVAKSIAGSAAFTSSLMVVDLAFGPSPSYLRFRLPAGSFSGDDTPHDG